MKIFYKLLSEAIENSHISKNYLSELTGVDRSTIHKYMQGTRIPTAENLQKINMAVNPLEEDQRMLWEEFEKLALDDMSLRNLRLFQNCMETIAESEFQSSLYAAGNSAAFFRKASQVPAPVPDTAEEGHSGSEQAVEYFHGDSDVKLAMRDFLIQRQGDMDMFLSPKLAKYLYSMYSLLDSGASDRTGEEQNCLRLLMAFPLSPGESNMSETMVYQAVLALLLEENRSLEIRYYYEQSVPDTGLGKMFPYYFLTDGRALIITADGRSAVWFADKDLIRCLRQAYQEGFEKARKLRVDVSDITEEQDFLSAYVYKSNFVRINSDPEMLINASEEMLRRYVPEQMFSHVIQCHQSYLDHPDGISEVVSGSAIQKMAEQLGYNEIGVEVRVSKEDGIDFLLRLRDRVGKNLFIADDRRLVLPSLWCVEFVEGKYIVFFRENTVGDLIVIEEKNLLYAFSEVLKKNLGYLVLDDERAKKLIDRAIEQVEKL